MKLQFQLAIDAQQWLNYYQGNAQRVQCKASNGQWIHLHCRYLRPFVTSAGIFGQFELTLDRSGQFQKLVQL